MRIRFVSTLAISAILGLAGNAVHAQGVTGDAWLYVGTLSIDEPVFGDNISGESITGGAGRLGFALSPTFAAQLDLSSERVSTGGLGWIDDYTVSDVAGHVIYQTGGAKVGAMVSRGTTDAWPYTPGAKINTYALEGAIDSGTGKFTGQFGRSDAANGDDLAANFVRVEGRFSLSGNVSAGVNLGAGTVDYDAGDKVDFTTYGADIEYNFPQGPYSAFAALNGSKQKESDEGEEWTNTVFTVGVRIGFGSGDAPVFADYNPLTGLQHLRGGDWE